MAVSMAAQRAMLQSDAIEEQWELEDAATKAGLAQSIGSTIGGIGGFFIGGPAGAAIGSYLGGGAGKEFGTGKETKQALGLHGRDKKGKFYKSDREEMKQSLLTQQLTAAATAALKSLIV